MVHTPSRAFQRRDFHRRLLTLHFVVWVAALVGGLFVNRRFTPDRFWLPWMALVALAALTVHGVIFARSTLATMGGRPRPRR